MYPDNINFSINLPSANDIANSSGLVFTISKLEIISQNYKRINELIKTLNSVGKKAREKIFLSVSGYDDADEREIYQIPEIRDYYRTIQSSCPHFPYFLSNEFQNAICFLYCIFDIISEKIGTQMQISLDTRSGYEKMNKALYDYCNRVGDKKTMTIDTIIIENSEASFPESLITEDEYDAAMSYLTRYERAHRSIIPALSKDMALICDYPGLPDDLYYHHYYLLESGHCIMSIPQCLFIEAKENGYDDYDVPLPVRYVLEKGYKIIDNRVIVDVPYDNMLGAMVDDKYNEFDKKPGK